MGMELRRPRTSSSTQANMLLHLDSDFSDATGNHHPVASGPVTISSVQKKFGAGSALFANTSQSAITVSDNLSDFTWPGDFTVDMWFYPTDLSQSANLYNLGDTQFHIFVDFISSDGLYHFCLFINGANVVVGPTVVLNSWYHVAVTRAGGVMSFFINGNLAGTYSSTATFAPASEIWIGVYPGGQQTAGYIDEVHVLKGTAEWTADFAPPSSAYGEQVGEIVYMSGRWKLRDGWMYGQ